MIFKTLLTFPRAPYLNPVICKLFNHKRRFILNASDSVKHEDQKNIKLIVYSSLFQFLNRVFYTYCFCFTKVYRYEPPIH